MEKFERELILSLCPSIPRLRDLYEEHLKLEREVERFEQYSAYSASAQIRSHELKKEKLKGVDDMMAIISDYRRDKHPEEMVTCGSC